MYCPHCGQEQSSAQTRFCSRCGFALAAVADLIASGGVAPAAIQNKTFQKISPRKKGLRQGLFIFLLSFLVLPLITIITIMNGETEPFVVAIAAILLVVGGLLRAVYALMFKSNDSGEATLDQNDIAKAQHLLDKNQKINALPPQQTISASAYIPPSEGNWRDTNDLTPASVVENTTKFL